MQVYKTVKNGKPYWLAYERNCLLNKKIQGGSSHTRSEAVRNFQKNLTKELSLFEASTKAKTGELTLGSALEEWNSHTRSKELSFSPTTLVTDVSTIKTLKVSTLGQMPVFNIKEDDITAYFQTIAQASISKRRKHFFMLRMYFNYFYRQDTNHNPMNHLKAPKAPVRQQRRTKHLNILNDVEMQQLTQELLKTRNYQNSHNTSNNGYRNGKAVLVAMFLFLRIGELLGLQKQDIDLEHNIIHIQRQLSWIKASDSDTKGRWEELPPKYGSERSIPIFPPVRSVILEAYSKCIKENSYLFTNLYGEHLCNNSVRKTLNAALDNCNLKHIRLHDLRHTGISFLLRHEVKPEAVKEWAGHVSLVV